jgi:hypothetical protein
MLASASPTARSLARLLAGWLAVLLLVQGLAAAQGRVMGGWHRHAPVPAAGASLARIAFSHSGWEPGHHHDGLQRHVHPALDASVVAVDVDPEEQAAAAAAALAAMTGLLQTGHLTPAPGAAHVLRPADPWHPGSALTLPLRRPPRG